MYSSVEPTNGHVLRAFVAMRAFLREVAQNNGYLGTSEPSCSNKSPRRYRGTPIEEQPAEAHAIFSAQIEIGKQDEAGPAAATGHREILNR